MVNYDNEVFTEVSTITTSSAVFNNCSFQGFELSNVDFSNSTFNTCLFDNLALLNVDFTNAIFDACTFRELSLTNVDFSHVSFLGIKSENFILNWKQIGLDIDGEAANGKSGTGVALSGDGSRVAIGNGTSSGLVQIFEWDGSIWSQVGEDIPTHTYMRVNNMLTETLHPDCEL